MFTFFHDFIRHSQFIEYDGYDDVYGHSVDDESSLSPSDAQQWMYDRDRGTQNIASFLKQNKSIEEEDDEDADAVADELYRKTRRDSDVRGDCLF